MLPARPYKVSAHTAAGSPSRALRHRGAHPLAVFSFALLMRCERESNFIVLPLSAATTAAAASSCESEDQ